MYPFVHIWTDRLLTCVEEFEDGLIDTDEETVKLVEHINAYLDYRAMKKIQALQTSKRLSPDEYDKEMIDIFGKLHRSASTP